MTPKTQKGLVIKGLHQVALEQVPVPTIEEPSDVIIKVHISGLCGSDLHNYRQAEPGTGFVLGHEMVGEIVEVGSGVQKWKVGDVVSSPFSTCCGSCWFCQQGYTSRCTQANFFGCPSLQGCQAEYIRQPHADASLVAIPEGISKEGMLLLCDIFSTGFSAAHNARRLLDEDDERVNFRKKDGLVVIFGCGPVGLCAITSATTMFSTVIATDPNPLRLEAAKNHGAIPVPLDQVQAKILELTEGRGADAALDLVGGAVVLGSCLNAVRSYGAVSSIGMQTKVGELDYPLLYTKNVRMQFGRCNVRKFIPLAAKVLAENKELFTRLITNRVRLDEGEKYYGLFNAGKVGKTVFVMDGFDLQEQ